MQTQIAVSSYDAVNAFLISSIIVVGTLVSIMALLWMLSPGPAEIEFVTPDFQGHKAILAGPSTDLEIVDVEEFPEAGSSDLVVGQLESVSEAVSEIHRGGENGQEYIGTYFGQRQSKQSLGTPERKRWEIRYQTTDINDYAKQLRHFDIEIGVISRTDNKVVRLQQPGAGNKIIQSDRKSEQGKMYFVHQQERLRQWDDTIVQQNNIGGGDTFTVHFIPDSTRKLLRKLEAEYLRKAGKKMSDIRKIVFQIKDPGNGFEFEVKSVSFH